MALEHHIDLEVRTTGHDLNAGAFNDRRDPTNSIDYSQQDNAEIISTVWQVDSTNNTWLRSSDLDNWVNSGGVLTSLKGNHIHIAGIAIAGGVLFDWVASTAIPGAYYLQALGGGNPSWTTKPTRVWLNNVFTLENTSLPAGSNTWAWGDFDSLGYNTIYVRFGAELDISPAAKNQDDVIADGNIWTQRLYEIVTVGSDGNGAYIVLDSSPATAGSSSGYGRIGGALATLGGVHSVLASNLNLYARVWLKSGTYTCDNSKGVGYPGGCLNLPNVRVIGYDSIRELRYDWSCPSTVHFINNTSELYCRAKYLNCELSSSGSAYYHARAVHAYFCNVHDFKGEDLFAYGSYCKNVSSGNTTTFQYCYVENLNALGRGNHAFTIFKDCVRILSSGTVIGNVVYNSSGNGFYAIVETWIDTQLDSCIVVNASGYALSFSKDLYKNGCFSSRCFYYNCTNGAVPSGYKYANEWTILPGNPFRDPDNGDFRLADNEAGRMLKQAGFQIPGPQGAPPMKFDAGAVQNSFYDIASGGGGGANLSRIFAGM